MSLNPGAVNSTAGTPVSAEAIEGLVPAYLATYRGPHGGAPGTEAAVTAPLRRQGGDSLNTAALIEAQLRLGAQRSPGATRVGVYAGDDPGGFGPALQVVTDNASMLMDSVTVLLHRIGVAYKACLLYTSPSPRD